MKTVQTQEFDLCGSEEDINIFLAGLNTDKVHEDDAEKILEWAQHVIVQHGLLQNIMSGMAEITGWKDNAPMFALTEKGRDYVENNLLNPWPELLSSKEDGK